MKKIHYIIITTLVFAVFIAWKILPLPSITQSSTNQTVNVAATISPIANIAKHIGGTSIDVATVMPPGASPHTFEPTPQDVVSLQNVKTFFAVGHGLDNWVKPLTDNIPDAKIINVDHAIKLLSPIADEDEPTSDADPHYWLSIPNAKIIATNIADEFKRIDPTHATTYDANLANYISQLDQTDKYIRETLTKTKNKNLVTHHNAWRYFAQEYNLSIAGTFEVSPGREPTAQDLASLQNAVKLFGITTVYSEPQLSEQAVRPFTQDLKLNIEVLDPEGGLNNMGYIEMMRYNADTIANAK